MAIVPEGVRALSFTRHVPGSDDLPGQREIFGRVCDVQGWTRGVPVCQVGSGMRAWASVVRLVRSGACDLVIVDSVDRIAGSDAGRAAVLRLLERAGVRLVIAAEGIDTGDPIGAALVSAWAGGARAEAAR